VSNSTVGDSQLESRYDSVGALTVHARAARGRLRVSGQSSCLFMDCSFQAATWFRRRCDLPHTTVSSCQTCLAGDGVANRAAS
jgi:hypothetical protein